MTNAEPSPLNANGEPAKELSSYSPVSQMTMHGIGPVLFSLPFLGAGVGVILIAAKVIPMEASKIHAPLWVIGAAGAAFFLAGASVLYSGVAGLRRTARLNAKAAAYPNEPWLADYEWNPQGIESRSGASLGSHVLGLGVVVSMMSVFNWVAFVADTPTVVGFFAGLFDLVFLAIIVSILRKAIAHLQYGKPTLEFASFPVRPGQLLRTRITTNQDLGSAESLVVHLRYIEERYETRGTGKNRTTSIISYECYSETRELHGIDARKMCMGGLEVDFKIPQDARTNDLRSRPACYWSLEVHAEIPGFDFKHHFLLPIYNETRTSSRRLAA